MLKIIVLAMGLSQAAPPAAVPAVAAPAPVAAAPRPTAPAPATAPYRSMFVDWSSVAPAAVAAEAAPQPGRQRSPAEADALGRRIGEVVASGDCRGGEQLALDAGDYALARAVRDHCNAPAGQ